MANWFKQRLIRAKIDQLYLIKYENFSSVKDCRGGEKTNSRLGEKPANYITHKGLVSQQEYIKNPQNSTLKKIPLEHGQKTWKDV